MLLSWPQAEAVKLQVNLLISLLNLSHRAEAILQPIEEGRILLMFVVLGKVPLLHLEQIFEGKAQFFLLIVFGLIRVVLAKEGIEESVILNKD